MAGRVQDVHFAVKACPAPRFRLYCGLDLGFAIPDYAAGGDEDPYPILLRQEWDNFGSPHLGVARIAGEEVANGKPIEKRWLRLKHRTGRPSNFGKAKLLVSVDFDPVGPVRDRPLHDHRNLLIWP